METPNELPQRSGKGTSFTGTYINGLNALSGVGILSIPYALAQGGWLSLMLLFLVSTISYYTSLLLQRCMESNPQIIKTYPDIGALAFGYKGRAAVSIFMYLELFLVAVEFLILEGDNLENIFPNMWFEIATLKVGAKQAFVILASLIVLPTTWLRNLGVLAYVSAGGVLASAILVLCVFWVGAVEGAGFDHHRNYNKLLNLRGLPTTLSLFAFCFSAHPVFPMLCSSMKDKSQFPKVLIVCFVISTINYGSMGILGYLMYGENLKSQVTLNLPTKKLSSRIAIYTTLINPLTKYAIMMNPIANAIEDSFPFHNSRSISIIIRTVLVMSTTFMALAIPFFGYIMAFIGAFLSITVSMFLPCFCYLKIKKAARRSIGVELIIIIGILVLGSFVCVVGTYTSVKQIVNHLSH